MQESVEELVWQFFFFAGYFSAAVFFTSNKFYRMVINWKNRSDNGTTPS